jgi:hypothetical protein
MSNFQNELNKAVNPHQTRLLKADKLIADLRAKGEKDEADAIDAALSDTSIPAFTVFRALENSGYSLSYNAIQSVRRQRANIAS